MIYIYKWKVKEVGFLEVVMESKEIKRR